VAFRVPTAEWLRGPLAATFRTQLEEGPLYEQGWFDRPRISTLLAQHESGHDHSNVLWPLFALSSWLNGAGRMYG
jgi:asparagine synthase (glutamine-hydrolysing)